MRLRHIAQINPATPEFERMPSHALVPFLPLEAVWPGAGLDTSRRRPKGEVVVGYTRFLQGDVLVPKITPTFQADRTVIAYPLEGGVGAGTTELHVVRPSPRIEPRYVRYLLSSKPFLDKGEASMIGVAGQKRVPDTCLRDLAVPVTDPSLQGAIADFLDDETAQIERLVRHKLHLADLLAERAQAARSRWWSSEASSVGLVSLRRLGARIEQGWSPTCDSEPAELGQWGVLKTSAVTGGRFDPTQNKRLPIGTSPDPRWLVREGDLLVVRGSGSAASVGAVAVAYPGDQTLTISDLIYRVRGLRGGRPEFFAETLRAPQVRQQIRSTIRTDAGQTLKLRSDDVRDLLVPAVAPGDMDSSIASVKAALSRITRAQEQIHRHIQLLLERRRALITAAVTGKLKGA